MTAFGIGPAGTSSRILAPWLGAPVIFAGADAPGLDGMPSVQQLIDGYGLPKLRPLDSWYGIVGRDPSRSVMPQLYNAALREVDLPALYLPFQVRSLPQFLRAATGLGIPLRGLTVTAPHKEDALDLADVATPLARQCGAASALWWRNGRWQAHTTEGGGVLELLAGVGMDPAGRRAAVLGCGGAGRSVAAALRQAGATVTVANRGPARGRAASELLGVDYVPLSRFDAGGYQVLVHAAPPGERVPFPLAGIEPDAVLVELAYRDPPTALVAAARARGLRTIDGWSMLRNQAQAQFRILTGPPNRKERT